MPPLSLRLTVQVTLVFVATGDGEQLMRSITGGATGSGPTVTEVDSLSLPSVSLLTDRLTAYPPSELKLVVKSVL